MKTPQFLPLGLLVFLLSCTSEAPFETEFDKSLDQWRAEKKAKGSSYKYTISIISVFGFGSSTTITVRNDKVVGRTFEAFNFNPETQTKEITRTWQENENELHTHEEGAKALTLDSIYSSCKMDILSVNKDENFINFEADNNGIISNCTYFPKNCQDDCSRGFTIVSLEWIN